MGKTLATLANTEVESNPIFDDRFVAECCETYHIHWRNTRLELNEQDFQAIATLFHGVYEQAQRDGWKKPQKDQHIELGKASISKPEKETRITAELCENLYRTVYVGGCDFKDSDYIHLHYGDLRLEVPITEFRALASIMSEAVARLDAPPTTDLGKVFQNLNDAGISYVVLRNWQELPEQYIVGDHSDIDLLVDDQDVERFIEITRAAKMDADPMRPRFRIPIGKRKLGREHVCVDLRRISDGYYPQAFAERILENRVSEKCFYVPNPEDHYDSLLYHAVFHKGEMRDDYRETLGYLHEWASVGRPLSDIQTFESAFDYFGSKGITPETPSDRTVAPWLSSVGRMSVNRKRLSSRQLCILDGREYFSRVYANEDGTITKEASQPLAKQEYQMLSALSGGYFPKALDYEDMGEWGVTTMTRLNGESLGSFFLSGKVFSAKEAFRFAKDCLEILQVLIEHGVRHRDIQPGNVLVHEGTPALIDFGWSESEQHPNSLIPPLLGAEMRKSKSQVCDIYSMGGVLAFALREYPQFRPVWSAMMEYQGAADSEAISQFNDVLESVKSQGPIQRLRNGIESYFRKIYYRTVSRWFIRFVYWAGRKPALYRLKLRILGAKPILPSH